MPSEKRDRKPRASNFILQGGILAVAGIVTRIIGLFYRVPVTNIIGDEGNGYYAAAYQIYNIMLLISSYSLPLAISKIVSARYSKQQYTNSARVFRGGLVFACFSGGLVGSLIFFFPDFFAGTLMSEPMSAIALRVFAPTLLIVAIMGVVRGYFQGMGTMIPTAISQIIEQIVNAVVSILAARFLYGYGKKVAALLQSDHYASAYGAAGSTLGTSVGALAGLIFLLLVLLFVSASLRRARRNEDFHRMESMLYILRLILLTAVPVILSTAIYNVSDVLDNGIFNKIMTLQGQGVEKTVIWGVYSGKYKLLMNIPIALSNAMCASTVPALAAAMASDNKREAARKVSAAMRFTMLIAFPCCVGLGVLARPVLSMLFTGEIDLAAALVRAGCVSIIFFSMSTLSNGVLQGINHINLPVRNAIISLVLHLFTLYVMLEKFRWGIYAVLIANILFAFFMCILNQWSIKKHLNYRQELVRTFFVPGLSSILMGVVVFAMNKLFALFLPAIAATLIAIATGVIVYFVCILKLKGIRAEELYELPHGGVLARIAERLHLI